MFVLSFHTTLVPFLTASYRTTVSSSAAETFASSKNKKNEFGDALITLLDFVQCTCMYEWLLLLCLYGPVFLFILAWRAPNRATVNTVQQCHTLPFHIPSCPVPYRNHTLPRTGEEAQSPPRTLLWNGEILYYTILYEPVDPGSSVGTS